MTKQKRKAKPNLRRRIVYFTLVITFLSGALFYALQSDRQEEDTNYQPDYLLYQDIVSVPDDNAPLMIYDPVEQTHRELFAQTPTGVGGYYGTPSGDVIYTHRISMASENIEDIFKFNIFDDDITPVNLTNTPGTDERIIGWNDDHSYLAFIAETEWGNELYIYDGELTYMLNENVMSSSQQEQSLPRIYHINWYGNDLVFFEDHGNTTHVRAWDGETIRDVAEFGTFTEAAQVRILWHSDENFALTVWEVMPSYPNIPGVSAVYIWDGTTLQSVPNPSDFPQFTAHGWNRHNELILIARDEQYNNAVYVWDGETTLSNGQPDPDSYIDIGADFASVGSTGYWDHLDRLIVRGLTEDDLEYKYYLWNNGNPQLLYQRFREGMPIMTVTTNENDITMVIFGDGLRYAYMRAYTPDNTLLLESGAAASTPIWGANGHLALCTDRTVVWNGSEMNQVNGLANFQWLIGQSTNRYMRYAFCYFG